MALVRCVARAVVGMGTAALVGACGGGGDDRTNQGFAAPFSPVAAPYAGTWYGSAGPPRVHWFVFSVAQDGRITGTSTWGALTFGLSGAVDAQGNLVFEDDAPAQGYAVGIYAGTATVSGTANVSGTASGTYAEGTADDALASWSASRR